MKTFVVLVGVSTAVLENECANSDALCEVEADEAAISSMAVTLLQSDLIHSHKRKELENDEVTLLQEVFTLKNTGAVSQGCDLPDDHGQEGPGLAAYLHCLSDGCQDADPRLFDGSGDIGCVDAMAMLACGDDFPGSLFTMAEACPEECDARCSTQGAPAPALGDGWGAPAPYWGAPAPADGDGWGAPAPYWGAPAPSPYWYEYYSWGAPAPYWGAPAPADGDGWGAPAPADDWYDYDYYGWWYDYYTMEAGWWYEYYYTMDGGANMPSDGPGWGAPAPADDWYHYDYYTMEAGSWYEYYSNDWYYGYYEAGWWYDYGYYEAGWWYDYGYYYYSMEHEDAGAWGAPAPYWGAPAPADGGGWGAPAPAWGAPAPYWGASALPDGGADDMLVAENKQ